MMSIIEAETFYGIELLTKASVARGCAAAEAMFAEDLRGRIFGCESDQREVFLRLQLTAVRSADLSARGRADSSHCRGAKLATRNVAYFEDCGLP